MTELNLLAVTVGNTRTRVGAFIDGQLTQTAAFENQRNQKLDQAIADAFAPIRERPNAAVLLASVNHTVSDALEQSIRKKLHCDVKRVERDVPIPIGRQLDPEAIVGEDRLLNAAAAYDVLQQACAVVDAGTAITVDFVDGVGTFHGGAIAPGGQLMLDALSRRTAMLPEIELGKPIEPIGHNTAEAMRAGVFYGMRGMVRELVEQFADTVGAFPLVVVTGGDGDLLFRDWEMVDRVVPDLTLRGIAVTLRRALEQDADAND